MNRMNRLTPYLAILIVLAFPACSQDKETVIWTIGVNIFIMYCIILSFYLLLPKLHRLPAFIQLSQRLNKPLRILSIVLTTYGGWLLLSGIPALTGTPGIKKLEFFLGVMVLIGGCNLYKWTRDDEPGKKSASARIVFLTASFALGLLYIMSGSGIPV